MQLVWHFPQAFLKSNGSNGTETKPNAAKLLATSTSKHLKMYCISLWPATDTHIHTGSLRLLKCIRLCVCVCVSWLAFPFDISPHLYAFSQQLQTWRKTCNSFAFSGRNAFLRSLPQPKGERRGKNSRMKKKTTMQLQTVFSL